LNQFQESKCDWKIVLRNVQNIFSVVVTKTQAKSTLEEQDRELFPLRDHSSMTSISGVIA
jgi:hypothetical protein